MSTNLTIGTRGSALALVQTHWVRDQLAQLFPHLSVEISIIQTAGDQSQAANTPLSSYSEKGIFAKELEVALLDRSIDVAVHSMKDMAAVLPNNLHIASVPERQDVRDALIGKSLDQLAAGDRIGTGSVRRTALLRHLRPDVNILNIRGNVDTRIRKLRDGDYDAIILAVAGLNRLGRHAEISERLDPYQFVPDPGQGALAIQCRMDDETTNNLLAPLNHTDSFAAITAERAFLAEYGGGCQTPIGAWATVSGDTLTLIAMAALDNSAPRYTKVVGLFTEPKALGRQAANILKV